MGIVLVLASFLILASLLFSTPTTLLYRTNIQTPGLHDSSLQWTSVPLEMEYKTLFPQFRDDAYSKLLLHVLQGRHESFVRDDELECSWQLFSPILDNKLVDVEPYEQGSLGPPGRRDFLNYLGIVLNEDYADDSTEKVRGHVNKNGSIMLRSSL